MLHFGVLNNVLSIDYLKKKLINLQIVHYSLAWLGVYMLGYYNFSIGWMVTPLLLRWTKTTLHIYEKHIQYILNPWQIISDSDISWFLSSVLRDQWKKEKRKRLTAAREAALTNEQVGIHLFGCFYLCSSSSCHQISNCLNPGDAWGSYGCRGTPVLGFLSG